jgi:DNA-binding transcriptional ArsR family regulator
VESNLDQTLAALADPTRRSVVAMLRKKPLRPSDMANALSTSRPLMSRHLRVLRRAGLIEAEPQGDDARARTYRLRREPFAELRSWVQDVEAFWGDQLQAFKLHAERGRKGRAK